MKNHSLALAAAIMALCVNLNAASASLLGMPLQLKAAIDLSETKPAVPACQFYTDDVLTVPFPLLFNGR